MSVGDAMRPILVTQPSLPPLDEFVQLLEQIWSSRILTNGGEMHRRLESALATYLGIGHVALFNNGTNALLTALQAADLSGEVITTPYSFAATTHAMIWNRLEPVFVDIDPATFNIDPALIERAITPRTRAILPVHCYGVPCDTRSIADIAERYGLQVIYDAAHAFGVRDAGGSILRHGDFSVLSFHATKVFNTCEGGAVVCRDAAAKQRVDRLKNFGIVDADTIADPGLNGKMNELQAALGLLQLGHVDVAIARRRAVDARYRQLLAGVAGIILPPAPAGVSGNGAYFPVLIAPAFGVDRDTLYAHLHADNILVRKYFHPLLSDLPMYRHLPSAGLNNLPNAARVAAQVLCLPLHAALSDADVDRVVQRLRA
jgi:dTDP-4-amino-4,6-dideoxygalactose transaminase